MTRNWEQVFQGGQGFTPQVIEMLRQLEAELAANYAGSVHSVAAADASIVVSGSATDVELSAPGSGGGISSPLDIANCALWLDASQLALADNAAVATWPDLSGNGYDATQGTANNKPVCKTNIQNGMRAVRFDPTSHVQYMTFSGAALDLFRNLDGFTIAAVLLSGVRDTVEQLFSASDGDSNGYARAEFVNAGGVVGWLASNTDAVDADADSPLAAERNSITGGFSAPLAYYPQNVNVYAFDLLRSTTAAEGPGGGGVTLTFEQAAGPTSDTSSNSMQIGANVALDTGFKGDIGELIVYQRALSSSERRELIDFLSDKWATL